MLLTMKNKIISKNWSKLIGKDISKIKSTSADVNWIFELLGWEKDAGTNRDK